MSPDVLRVRLTRGEVAADEVRGLRRGRVGDRGAVPAPQPQSCQADAAHHPSDALVVDSLAAVAEFGGDPGNAVGAARFVVHGSYPGGEVGIGRLPGGPVGGRPAPVVEAGA